ncbi:MAG: phage tail protein I [Chloroflexi bacterium]|nr:phage tail protein I [Chloroflexota bacterium]
MIPTETTTRFIVASENKSRLLNYLPGIYADDFFLDGFLRIFESIWAPLERQIDQLYNYVEPRMTPADFLPWLGTWVDLALDENWPEARRRALIEHAADLYRRRGTAGALRDYLAIYTGTQPEIVEDGDDAQPFHFSVILRVPDPAAVEQDRVRRIIEEEKPAHTTYTLRVEQT